jgi:hypothetical protein
MKLILTNIAALSFVLSYFLPAAVVFGASAGMTRDQILAGAKNEGRLLDGLVLFSKCIC